MYETIKLYKSNKPIRPAISRINTVNNLVAIKLVFKIKLNKLTTEYS